MKKLSVDSCFFSTLCCAFLLSVVVSCTQANQKTKVAGGDVASKPAIIATIPDSDKPPKTIPGHEIDPASQSQPASFRVIFSESGKGAAYIAEKDDKYYVVHNGKAGKLYEVVGEVVLSSDGKRIAFVASSAGKMHMVVDGIDGKDYDGVLTPIFSPDSQHIVYQAKEGLKWYLVVDNIPNEGTLASYTTPTFNSGSNLFAYVEAADSNDKMRLIISDLTFNKKSEKLSIGDLLFTTNRDKTRIAAAQVVDKKLRIIDFDFAKPEAVHEGQLYDLIEQLTLSDDGEVVSYCALKDSKRLIILNNKEESLPAGHLPEPQVVRPDKKGLGLLLSLPDGLHLHQSFIDSKEKGKLYKEAVNLSYSKDGGYVYAANNGSNWFIVVNGTEGPAFDKVVAPQFSPDGKRIVYRARKDGKRFVVVADALGKTISTHTAYEQVFDLKFTADGKSVAYGVKDGQNLIWKVVPL